MMPEAVMMKRFFSVTPPPATTSARHSHSHTTPSTASPMILDIFMNIAKLIKKSETSIRGGPFFNCRTQQGAPGTASVNPAKADMDVKKTSKTPNGPQH